MATNEILPALTKHLNSLDQKFPTDGAASIEEQQSKDQNISPSQSPPPPLVDLVAVITPKQIKDSKKWSVGVNHASTALIFEYLESARLSIQNDGRLFKTTSKQTLSSAHSYRPSSNVPIPRISNISVPRQINFRNNAVVKINHQWHIGELLPMTYTANLRAPNISSITTPEPAAHPSNIK